MAAAMGDVDLPGLPVLALRRPRHEVDHVQHALRNDSMVILARESSKTFISYSLISEFVQRYPKKWTVVLTDQCSDHCTKELIETLTCLLPNKSVVRCFMNQTTEPSTHPHATTGDRMHNVMVTSSEYFQRCFANCHLKAENVSLVILNFCTPVNIALHDKYPFKQIMKLLNSCRAVKSRVVGLMQFKLNQISNAQDLKEQIHHVESSYGLPVHFSHDLLAMNSFGEEIKVEDIVYDAKPQISSSLVTSIFNQLKDILHFLCDVNIPESTKAFKKLEAVVACSIDILIIFGLWSLEYVLESIIQTLKSMETNESGQVIILCIQMCRSHFEIIEKILKMKCSSECPSVEIFSQTIHKMCDLLLPYKVYCNTNNVLVNEQDSLEGDETDKEKDIELNDPTHPAVNPKQSDETKAVMNIEMVKMKSKDQFLCVIVAKSNLFAKLISKSLNYLSSCDDRYSFLKCGCITHENNENYLLRAVQQGVINTVVTTWDSSDDLLITNCNVLMYFGVPETYHKFLKLKQKIRGLAPKLVLVIIEQELINCRKNLKIFKDIEEQFEKQMCSFLSLKMKEMLLRHLAKDSLSCYAPFGETGPCVSMISSIHTINRYCQKISRGDFPNIHAQFIIDEKDLPENRTAVTCTLYLPFGASLHKVTKSSDCVNASDLEHRAEILKLKMKTALECVKLLHECREMDDDLDLITKQFIDANETVVNCELEDEGKGRAGTNKRRRAYEIKVPSFFEDNMPVADQALFLHKIHLEHSTSNCCSRPDAFSHLPNPEIELGILSRKQFPRIPKFTIYTLRQEVTVSLIAATVKSLRLDQENLDLAKVFHQHIFQDLLKLRARSPLSEKDGFLIVPLVPGTATNQASVHFTYLKEFELQVKGAGAPSKSQIAQTSGDFSIFVNRMVRRTNQIGSRLTYDKYCVVKVCHDLNPGSPFPEPDVAATFAEYYRNRYEIELNLDQPLLQVQYASAQINFLFPRTTQSGDKPSEENSAVREKLPRTEIHLIPQLCSILPLSIATWRIVRYLPTIVYRLNTLLLAKELLSRIHQETGVGCDRWPDELPLPDLVAGDTVGEERLEMPVEDNVGKERSGRILPIDDSVEATYSVAHNHGNHSSELNSSPGDENSKKIFPKVEEIVEATHVPEEYPTRDHCHGNHTTPSPEQALLPAENPHPLPSPTSGPEIGPNLTLLLRAVTAKSAGQYFHSERLEVLGDSVLKLEVSLELYLTENEKDEWGLSVLRSYLVSNDYLSRQGRRVGLPGYMSTNVPDIAKNCLPPGFIFIDEQNGKHSSYLAQTTESNNVSEVPLNTYHHQVLGDKLVANCVESLIGAYLVSSGRRSARRLLIWLGVAKHTLEELETLFPTVINPDIIHSDVIDFDVNNADVINSLVIDSDIDQSRLDSHVVIKESVASSGPEGSTSRFLEPCQTSVFGHIEEAIGYVFKNKHLLLQAVTHTSYMKSLSFVRESYQKLEFLGDAVLDYLVTLHLFARFPGLNHGDLSDFRSALVNNFTLAFLAVKNHLHQSLRSMSSPLIDVVKKFVDFLEEQEMRQGASWKTSVDAFVVGNPEIDESDVEVPKVLGDVFESVVCAVFLDCEMDLDVMWNIFYPMLQPFIDYYKDNIPRSPVRTLQELFPEQVKFSLVRQTLSRKYVCNVSVVGYGTFEATGRTSKIAKSSVARKALQTIRSVSSTTN